MSIENIPNPYKTTFSSFSDLFTRERKKENDRIVAFADRLVEKGGNLFTNEEKRLEFIGIAAKILDWGVFTIVGGIEGTVLAEKIVRPLHVTHLPIFKTFPVILSLIMIPASVFFLAIATFEAGIEFLHLRRGILLLGSIEKRKGDPVKAMEWLKSRFFSLDEGEAKRIYAFIEKSGPHLSRSEKALRFDGIAEKALEIKYDSLKRRISPGLAEEVKKGLTNISKERAEIFVQSLSRQAKNKVLVHAVAILALSCTIISMSVFLGGIAAGPFFVIMGSIAVSLLLISTIISKGVMAKEGERLYDKLAEINQQIVDHSTDLASLQEAL
ncbi:MAG: hypothetical protein P0S96_03780 [Simkaniaceae bacterium]|nr:hypothetical protein [Candidatus Sacchlamyda saccharinae]